MSLGEMLHRLGSAIGLYPEDRAQEDYDDYDESYPGEDYSRDDSYRNQGRSTVYQQRPGSAAVNRGSSSRTTTRATGTGYGASGSASSYDTPPERRTERDNVVQMPQRGNTGLGGLSGLSGNNNSGGASSASNISYGSFGSQRDTGYSSPAAYEPAQKSASSSRHSEIIVYVRRKDDAQQIIGYVLEERSVILNCESIDDAQCQRVIDMLGGAAYAIGGHVQRVSHRNYLFAPANVEVSSSDSQSASRFAAAASQS